MIVLEHAPLKGAPARHELGREAFDAAEVEKDDPVVLKKIVARMGIAVEEAVPVQGLEGEIPECFAGAIPLARARRRGELFKWLAFHELGREHARARELAKNARDDDV